MGLSHFHGGPSLDPFPGAPSLSSLQPHRNSHIFKACEFERVCGDFFFFFCFPQQSYFKSVLPLFPPPGLFCLVLAHLRSGHLHQRCRLRFWRGGGTAGCLGGQSPSATLAVGGSLGKGDQSLEGCLYLDTQDHAAGLAGLLR